MLTLFAFVGLLVLLVHTMGRCSGLEQIVNNTLGAFAFLTLLLTTYIYFFEAPKLSYRIMAVAPPTLSNGMIRYSYYFHFYSPGKTTKEKITYGPPVVVSSAIVLSPWEFLPSAEHEWKPEMGKEFKTSDDGNLTPVIEGKFPLEGERLRIPFHLYQYYFYSGKKTESIAVTLKIVGSSDPMDQGIFGFIREVFKYTLTANLVLPGDPKGGVVLQGEFENHYF